MKKTYMLEGFSIGLLLGIALCCASQFEIPIGAGVGSLIGCAIGAVLKKERTIMKKTNPQESRKIKRCIGTDTRKRCSLQMFEEHLQRVAASMPITKILK